MSAAGSSFSRLITAWLPIYLEVTSLVGSSTIGGGLEATASSSTLVGGGYSGVSIGATLGAVTSGAAMWPSISGKGVKVVARCLECLVSLLRATLPWALKPHLPRTCNQCFNISPIYWRKSLQHPCPSLRNCPWHNPCHAQPLGGQQTLQIAWIWPTCLLLPTQRPRLGRTPSP